MKFGRNPILKADQVIGRVVFDDKKNPRAILSPSKDALRAVRTKVKKALKSYTDSVAKKTLKHCPTAFSDIDLQILDARSPPSLTPSISYVQAVPIMCQIIRSDSLVADSCFANLIVDQLENSIKEDARGVRFSETTKQLFISAKFLQGKAMTELLTGKANQGTGNKGGHLPNDPKDRVFYGPSNSSLKTYIDTPQIFKPGDEGRLAEEITRLLRQKGHDWLVGGVAFDEIEIKSGAVYDSNLCQLLGLASGVIAEKDIDNLQNKDLTGLWGKKVIQVFFTSLDGTVTVPLYYQLTVGITADEAYTLVFNIHAAFKVHNLQILYSSSDGFTGASSYAKRIAQIGIYHVFDYTHMAKLARNALLDRVIVTDDCPTGFCVRTLVSLYQHADPCIRNRARELLTMDCLKPQDKMALKPLKKLINPDLVAFLNSLQTKDCAALGTYLSQVHSLYYCFNSNNDVSETLNQLGRVASYFSKIKEGAPSHSITDPLHFQITQSVEGLTHIVKNAAQRSKLLVSSISTLVVEHFFSTVRQKCLFPNFKEYAYTYNSAMLELKKKHLGKPIIPFKNKQFSKSPKYGCLVGVYWGRADVELTSPTLKKKAQKELKAQNQGSSSQKATCKSIVEKYPPTNKKLTIREATCKENPTKQKFALILTCPVSDCPRSFTYPKSFANHLYVCHFDLYHSLEDATATVKRIETSQLQQEQSFITQPTSQHMQPRSSDVLCTFRTPRPVPSPSVSHDIQALLPYLHFDSSRPYMLFTILFDLEHNGGTNQRVIELSCCTLNHAFSTHLSP